MSERSLQADNARLRREVAELKGELADERRKNKPAQEEYKVVPTVVTAPPEKKPFDPYGFSDPVTAALSNIPRLKPRRRSWLNE
jgi:hypothetical protein